MPEQELENIYCVFNLPFKLAVPDSIKMDKSKAEEKEIFVNGTIQCGISICSILREKEFPLIVGGDIEGGDPYGVLSYSRVQVRFNKGANHGFESWKKIDIVHNAVSSTNRLISIYREVFHKPIISTLSAHDIINYKIVHDYKSESKEFLYSIPRGPACSGYDPQKYSKLVNFLNSDHQTDYLYELHLEACRFGLLENHRLTIIQSALLFELWLKDFINTKKGGQPFFFDYVKTSSFLNRYG